MDGKIEMAKYGLFVKTGLKHKVSPHTLVVHDGTHNNKFLMEEEYCREQIREFLKHQRDI